MKNHPGVIKIVTFLAVLLVILNLLSMLFTPKNVIGSIYDEPANSLDYLAIGDSECYTSLSPMELWKSKGYVGYNCGVILQRIQDAYYQLEKILVYQTPKVIMMETNLICRKQGLSQEMQVVFDHYIGNTVSIYKYHNEWRRILSSKYDGGSLYNEKNVFKGMKYKPDVSPYLGGPYANETTDVQEIGLIQHIYLEKIVDLCKAKNIQLILYSAPSPRCWSYKAHNAVAKYAEENGLSFIDFNLKTDELGIDWMKDTYDKGDHMNFSGALKVTNYLGQYLSENMKLSDHRKDKLYEAWYDKLDCYLEATGQHVTPYSKGIALNEMCTEN